MAIDLYVHFMQFEEMKRNGPLLDKSFEYSKDVIKSARNIQKHNKEFVLTDQWMRSSTSIGANIRESKYAQSKRDFIHKMSIALKETNESEYWLELLHQTDFMDSVDFDSHNSLLIEIKRMLIASLKTVGK